MLSKARAGRSGSGRGDSGQSSVEWIGLVLLVSGAFAALSMSASGLAPPLAAFVHSVNRTILCAVGFGGGCPDGPSLGHYGPEVAALVRKFEPEISFGEDLLGMPVDFRTCRSPGCAVPPGGGGLAVSTADERLTIFTRVIDCRSGADSSVRCEGRAEGNLYIQFWAYFPESATFRHVPLLAREGYHRHDWESVQFRIEPDGTVSQRASSHAGHNHTRSVGNWPSDVGIDLPDRMERMLGRESPGGWGPWTGRWLIEGGSHAGNVADPGRTDREVAESPKGGVRLVPLESLNRDPLARPARFDPITPPWRKHLWIDPEAIGTG